VLGEQEELKRNGRKLEQKKLEKVKELTGTPLACWPPMN
jgi:hypothetical protein